MCFIVLTGKANKITWILASLIQISNQRPGSKYQLNNIFLTDPEGDIKLIYYFAVCLGSTTTSFVRISLGINWNCKSSIFPQRKPCFRFMALLHIAAVYKVETRGIKIHYFQNSNTISNLILSSYILTSHKKNSKPSLKLLSTFRVRTSCRFGQSFLLSKALISDKSL